MEQIVTLLEMPMPNYIECDQTIPKVTGLVRRYVYRPVTITVHYPVHAQVFLQIKKETKCHI